MHDVLRLIDAANAARARGDFASAAEQQLEARFNITHILAVYGTLRPGEPNHHVVEPLGGVWSDGLIEGDLHPTGWGAILGYAAFLPRTGGAEVKVKVLTSAALPAAWPRLDEFEGPEYRRMLVAVFGEGRKLAVVANLYAAQDNSPIP